MTWQRIGKKKKKTLWPEKASPNTALSVKRFLRGGAGDHGGGRVAAALPVSKSPILLVYFPQREFFMAPTATILVKEFNTKILISMSN
jgi:hypothetical protein